uniref:Ovule protein n=1 Tax=Ascaris lumbricoides TaxID=6252 RepID=A0A0M3I7I5_ASCLU
MLDVNTTRETRLASSRSRSTSRKGTPLGPRTTSKSHPKIQTQSRSKSTGGHSCPAGKHKLRKQYTSFRRIFTKNSQHMNSTTTDKSQAPTQQTGPSMKINEWKKPSYAPYRQPSQPKSIVDAVKTE